MKRDKNAFHEEETGQYRHVAEPAQILDRTQPAQSCGDTLEDLCVSPEPPGLHQNGTISPLLYKVRQHCERFTQSILDSLSAHVAVLDATGTIIQVNRAWRTFAQDNDLQTARSALGVNYLSVCDTATGAHSEGACEFAGGIRAVLAGTQAHFALEYPCHAPHLERWYIGHVTRFVIDTRHYLVIAHEDITHYKCLEQELLRSRRELELRVQERTDEIAERIRAEQALRESELRYRMVSELVSDYAYAFRVDPDGTLVHEWTTEAHTRTTGFMAEELDARQGWFTLIHPQDQPVARQHLLRLLAGKSDVSEFRIVTRKGATRWLRDYGKPVWDPQQGRVVRIYGAAQDITDRKIAERQLRYLALYDVLTGLPNRTTFLQLLGQAIERLHNNPDAHFAVMLLDLDNFKVVNDSLGHLDGDRLLTTMAHRLKECLRADDLVARLSGDEFVILLNALADRNAAINMAQRIQEKLGAPLYINNQELTISTSIGIVMSSPEYRQSDELLRDADTAMYHAKRQGPGNMVVFDTMMHTLVVQRLHTEAALRHAIEYQELRLHYQPIVSLVTGQTVGFEALVRWQHPRLGTVSPAEFLPIAEETGLIIPITWWVVETACRQMHAWHERFPSLQPLSMSVNLSVTTLMHTDIVSRIGQILGSTGLDPRSLKLEITEDKMMDHAATTITTLTRLRDLGVQLCIDDFGTGYSSLRYLHRLPIQTIKIDRSFVGNLHKDDESSVIVQSIVTLSHTLGKEVVAEGIETAEQLAYLQSLNCVYGQGYLFSRPVASQVIDQLLARQAAT